LKSRILCGAVQVDLMHQHEREQVLPQLHALLEEGQAAHVFAQEQVMADLQQFWDMPAMHLRPKHLCEYRYTTAPGRHAGLLTVLAAVHMCITLLPAKSAHAQAHT
jgi:hypothetical protein